MQHSRYVDALEDIFDDYVSLEGIWYFREGFMKVQCFFLDCLPDM